LSEENVGILYDDDDKDVGEECDIFLDADKSISRKHATVNIGDLNVKQVILQSDSDSIIKPTISVSDSSKYGTFTMADAPVRVAENSTVELSENTRLRFGVYQSIYQ